MKDNKKIIMPLFFSILTLLALVSGATFAYYTVETRNNFKTLKSSVSAGAVGSVAISSGPNLNLNLTRPELMQFDNDKVYYATANGSPVETQEEKPVIATATVTGPGTFTCTYKIHVEIEGNLYQAFKESENKTSDELVLIVNDTNYDFNSETDFTNGFDIDGTIEGLSEDNSKTITAQFKFTNKKEVNQEALINKNITFNFTLPTFDCEVN